MYLRNTSIRCAGVTTDAFISASLENKLQFTLMKQTPIRRLVIARVRDQGHDTRSFDLLPIGAGQAHGVAFIPGQVAILGVNDEEPAYFAFASAPADRELEFLIKRTAGASAAIFDMKEAGRIDLLGVTGHGFDLDRHRGRDLVLVAMGTGVAPLRSAFPHVLTRKHEFGQLVAVCAA